MEIKTIESKFLKNMFRQNTYVFSNKNEAVIVDAGAELEDVVEAAQGKKVLAVLITHIHFDHVWNLEKYVEHFDCDVYVVENQEKRFVDFMLNGGYMLRQNFVYNIPKNNIKYYAEKLKLGGFEIDVFNTPGHTEDSVCLLVEGNLFSGDTLFEDCVGRTDLTDGSAKNLVLSLQKIKDIKFERLYPGHYESASNDKAISTIMFYI